MSGRLRVEDSPEEDARKSKYLDLSLESTKLVLATLKGAAGFAPVPFLAQAATLALGVLDMAELTKNNKSGFKGLARDCCGLVYAIARTLEATSEASPSTLRNNPHDPTLAENIHELTGTLGQIQALTKAAATRRWVSRFVFSKLDERKIQDYQEMLKSAMQKFGLQSDISIRTTMSRMVQEQSEILKKLDEIAANMKADRASRETERQERIEQEKDRVASEAATAAAAAKKQGDQQNTRGTPPVAAPAATSRPGAFFHGAKDFSIYDSSFNQIDGDVHNTYNSHRASSGYSGNTFSQMSQ